MKTKEELQNIAMEKYPFVDVLPRELGYHENDLADKQQEAFMAGYIARQDEDRWVSVEESLPSTYTPVLTVDINGNFNVLNIEEYGIGIELEYGWYSTDILDSKYMNITHWQPLPNPPKK